METQNYEQCFACKDRFADSFFPVVWIQANPYLKHRNILPMNRKVSRSLSDLCCVCTSIQAILRLLPICRFPEGHTCLWHPQWKQNSQNLSDILHTSAEKSEDWTDDLAQESWTYQAPVLWGWSGGRSLEIARQIAAAHFFWHDWSW